MTVKEVMDSNEFQVLVTGKQIDRVITDIYCGDLLSMVMSRAPSSCAWITVMSNMNTIAVASFLDVAFVIFAEGVVPGEDVQAKASEHGITIFFSQESVYHTARKLDRCRETL